MRTLHHLMQKQNTLKMQVYIISAIVFSVMPTQTNGLLDYLDRLPYNTIDKCKATEYFDAQFFSCSVCDAALGLQPSLNRQSCQCDATNATTIVDYDNETKMPICNINLAQNYTRPPECPTRHLILIPSQSIQTQHVQIFRNYSLNCTECTTSKTANIMLSHLGHNYCVQRPLVNDLLPYDNYLPSNPAFSHLAALTFFCQTMKDTQSCNRLANLCVLSKYTSAKWSPCSIFFASSQQTPKIDDKTSSSREQLMRPIVFYRPGKDSVDMLAAVLRQTYDNEINGEKNQIKLLQTRYDVFGQLKTMQPLLVADLNPCTSSNRHSNVIHFGSNVHDSCRISLVQMIAHAEKLGHFLDLYLNHTTEVDKRSTTFLVPIPMLVRGASNDNWFTNRAKWQLVNRICWADTFTDLNAKSLPSASSLSNTDELQRFNTVRVVNHIELRITLANDHNQIFVPLLIVDHVIINTSSLRTSDESSRLVFTFKITFAKSYQLATVVQGILPVLVTLGILAVFGKTYRYKLRQQRMFVDVDIFAKCVVYAIAHTADVLFASSALVCSYVLYVYWNQSSVRVVLPIEGQELLDVFVYVAVPLKIGTVLVHMWRKCNMDIFFVDWERPKAFDNHSIVKNTTVVETPTIGSGGKLLMYDGVSAWRTYFVANEWMKLATKRRTSMRFQMVAVIAVVLIVNGGYVETSAKIFQDSTMRIATSFLLYLTVYLVQRLLFVVIFERYFNNTVQRFVDVCSLANVSVFVLELDSFGYYVHGRSPHGFADTDMCSMSVHLKREEQNTFGARGLMLNSDQQSFTLLLPMNFRMLYDRLAASMLPPANHTSYEAHMERTAGAYYNINRFLNAFIDHGLKDLDYMIQDKTIWQRVLEYENAAHCTENRGVFYSDANAQPSFTNVLFYGNEWSLFGVEIMVFVLIAGCCGHYLTAMLAVAAINRLMRIVFARLQKTNLGHKTRIESRFLF